MGRAKKPIELVISDGKKHLTKAEIELRKSTEVKANSDGIAPPDFLTDIKQQQEFIKIADELIKIDIMSNLDCDVLGQYIKAKGDYIYYDGVIQQIRKKSKGVEQLLPWTGALKEYEGMKDKAFKQSQTCASALGLTISSRCKLVVPKVEESKENKFDRFNKRGVG